MILVVRLLDHRGSYVPRTYVLGSVEIRNPRAETDAERRALEESGRFFGDALGPTCMRIATLVDAASTWDADDAAAQRFEEALDVIAPESHGLSDFALLQSGFFFDIKNGAVSSRKPMLGRTPSTSFRMMREWFARCDWPQFLFSQQQTDLSQRLVRSYHWSRRAHLEASNQLRVLFRWFAMEAIWMLTKDDDIVPRIMWLLGFPCGPGAAALSRAFTARLSQHKTISAWKSQIEDRLRKMRGFRNDSVHSGFRPQDIPRNVLGDFEHITLIACARVQACAKSGILGGLSTAEELFEYLPVITEANSNYVNDVHNNILFGLENPAMWRRGRR
jgi:hypothetical protein